MARRKGKRERGEGRGERGESSRRTPGDGSLPSPFSSLPSLRERARPWLLAAATALWVARPLFPSESAASQGDGLPAVMLWIALAVMWLLGVIGQPRFRVRFGWVDLAVLVLVAWHTVAALWAAAHLSPRPAVNVLWEWVGFAVSFLVTRQLVAGPRETRAMAAVMCSLAVALAAFGLYQYHYEMPATRAAYEADPEKALSEANLSFPAGSPQRAMFEKRLASVEPIATFALTNSLAGLLAPWLVVLVGMIALGSPELKWTCTIAGILSRAVSARLGVSDPSPNRATLFRRRLSLLGTGICALLVASCLLLTKSRSAYLAVLFGLVLVGLAWRRKSARVPWKFLAATVLLAAALLVAAFAVGGLDREVLTEATKSLGYRGQYWRSSLAMIANHPWMGCGPGNFQDAYKAYKLPDASEEIADPHNFLFEVWATAGTPAMLALVVVLAAFFVTLLRLSVWAETTRTTSCGAGVPPAPRTAGETPAPQSTIESSPERRNAEKEHPTVVYAGALAGFALVVPLSAVSVAPPDRMFFLLAIPCLGLAMGALWSWVTGGQLSAGLAAIGVAVLLVDLSAAGGISFAGVGGSLWLLIAIGLNTTEGRDRNPIPLPGWCGFVLLAAACVVAFACYASAYGPVLRSQAATRLAQRHPVQAEKHLLEAAEADPLAAEPWNQLAAQAFAGWKANSGNDLLRRFESYSERALARAPNSSPIWETLGDRYLEIYERTKQSYYLTRAETALRRAMELYPNSAASRAKLALALRAAGDEAGYDAERNRALELDQLTPHLDKKLPAELRRSLQRR